MWHIPCRRTAIRSSGLALTHPARPEAWIAVIPEPGTALLMGLGLLAMGVRGRPARGRFPLGLAGLASMKGDG